MPTSSVPATPPIGPVSPVLIHGDFDFLQLGERNTTTPWMKRRDAPLDPLLFAAAVASGPHVTRHHYHHDFFPSHDDEAPYYDDDDDAEAQPAAPRYVSKQAPRSQRLLALRLLASPTPSTTPPSPLADHPHDGLSDSSTSVSRGASPPVLDLSHSTYLDLPEEEEEDVPQVRCMVRTRIPTEFGPVFLHLYHNDRDGKEHLAIVVDPAQLAMGGVDEGDGGAPPFIRSRSLDAVWSEEETEMDRLVRGAYVGRLTPSSHVPSTSGNSQPALEPSAVPPIPAPLVRIHSECFTGETLGSTRCDCGEQLSSALQLISHSSPARGAIIYLRQEGRGIGLLSKLRAYNLQDMGHDTLSANLALGFRGDEREYAVAGAILRDLGMESGVRVLTNNPEKVSALEAEGVAVVERVGMVPWSWRCQGEGTEIMGAGQTRPDIRRARTVGGEDLDKYLRTKVTRMGHLLDLPTPRTDAQQQ